MAGSRCEFPGCTRMDRLINIPVGPDWPSVLEPESLDDILKDGPQTYIEALACEEHVHAVKRMLMERHQPRYIANREGRPHG